MTTEAPPKAQVKKGVDPFTAKFVETREQPFWNVVLYGPEGTGKTVGALSAPGPVLLLNAEGENAAHFARTIYSNVHEIPLPMSGGAKDLLDEALLWLKSPAGEAVKTVVLDSLSEVHGAILRDMAKDPDHPTLPERGDTNTWLERYAMSLRDLPQNVVLVCHEIWTKDEVTGVIERSPNPGSPNVAFGKKFTGPFADIVGYTARVDEKGEETKFMAQLVDGNGRRAKNRGGVLGKFAELNLTEWFALLGAPETEGK